MKIMRQSEVRRLWAGRAEPGDVVICDILGQPSGSGHTETAAREDVRRVAEIIHASLSDLNGEAYLVVAG